MTGSRPAMRTWSSIPRRTNSPFTETAKLSAKGSVPREVISVSREKGTKNGFLKQFTIIGGGTFFNLLLGLFSTPVITRIVAPSEYGQLSIFTMYSGIALMVLCMGLDQAVVRYYYEKENLEICRSSRRKIN